MQQARQNAGRLKRGPHSGEVRLRLTCHRLRYTFAVCSNTSSECGWSARTLVGIHYALVPGSACERTPPKLRFDALDVLWKQSFRKVPGQAEPGTERSRIPETPLTSLPAWSTVQKAVSREPGERYHGRN